MMRSSHVLEHIVDIESFLKDAKRALKDTGAFIITVPHFSNSLAYSDYTPNACLDYILLIISRLSKAGIGPSQRMPPRVYLFH